MCLAGNMRLLVRRETLPWRRLNQPTFSIAQTEYLCTFHYLHAVSPIYTYTTPPSAGLYNLLSFCQAEYLVDRIVNNTQVLALGD